MKGTISLFDYLDGLETNWNSLPVRLLLEREDMLIQTLFSFVPLKSRGSSFSDRNRKPTGPKDRES